MGDDARLTTAIHVAGGSFDGNGASNLHAPAAYICGENDTLATPNRERDYGATGVPVFFTVMSGIDHIQATAGGKPAITSMAALASRGGGIAQRRVPRFFLHVLWRHLGVAEQEFGEARSALARVEANAREPVPGFRA